ncbi:MAG: hypothetical protein AB7F98_06270 [Novosphingobium sp.]
MKTITKALAGSVAAGAMALSAVSPAYASDSLGRSHGGISAGEVIAGALVLGGIAAIASSSGKNRYDYDYGRAGYRDGNGRYGYNNGWNINPRQAIDMCVRGAKNIANRQSYGGRANVTDIRDVRNTRFGYEVRGRIAVNTMGHNWRAGDFQYGRGWNNDYRGWNSGLRGYDSGSFKCRVERGRIVDMDFSGIRGL